MCFISNILDNDFKLLSSPELPIGPFFMIHDPTHRKLDLAWPNLSFSNLFWPDPASPFLINEITQKINYFCEKTRLCPTHQFLLYLFYSFDSTLGNDKKQKKNVTELD